MNTIISTFLYPHHAQLTVATGKPDSILIIHTPKVSIVKGDHQEPGKIMKEITVLTGEDEGAMILTVHSSLRAYNENLCIAPNYLYFASAAFDGEDFDGKFMCCNKHLDVVKLPPTMLIPHVLSDLIMANTKTTGGVTHYPNGSNIIRIILQIAKATRAEKMMMEGRSEQRLGYLTEDGSPTDDSRLTYDMDFAQALKPWNPLIVLLGRRPKDSFPYGFQETTNEISQSFFARLCQAVNSRTFNYDLLQSYEMNQDLDVGPHPVINTPPIWPPPVMIGQGHLVPMGRKGEIGPYLRFKSQIKPINPRPSKIHRCSIMPTITERDATIQRLNEAGYFHDNDKSKLTKRQLEHEEKSRVAQPINTPQTNSDDESLFPSNPPSPSQSPAHKKTKIYDSMDEDLDKELWNTDSEDAYQAPHQPTKLPEPPQSTSQ